jgi:integrase/recombinase XerD
MALGKRAKILTEAQQKVVLSYLAGRRLAQRNTVMFLLSVDAGLRAKEIAALEWAMVTDAQGALTDEIRLQDRASKGRSGGVVFMSKRLRVALEALAAGEALNGPLIKAQGGRRMGAQTVVNWFFKLYLELGFYGCSSNSGRRTAITRLARNTLAAGGSMRDVQSLARHNSLAMTQRYVEVSGHAMRKAIG